MTLHLLLNTLSLQIKVKGLRCLFENCWSCKTNFISLGHDPNFRNHWTLSAVVSSLLSQLCTSLIAFCFPFSQLVQLDSLFAYWNVNSVLFSNHRAEEALVSHPIISVLHLVSTLPQPGFSHDIDFFSKTQRHYCDNTDQSWPNFFSNITVWKLKWERHLSPIPLKLLLYFFWWML